MRLLAMLRGINVGGKNILPMKELAAIFAESGCGNVSTYIQSGNVIFDAPRTPRQTLASAVSAGIQTRYGYKIPIILRTPEEMRIVRDSHPNLGAENQGHLHVYFLPAIPAPAAVAALDPHRSPSDTYRVIGKEIYLLLPNGMGRTKLTNAYFDAKLSTISTARNWATIRMLNQLLGN